MKNELKETQELIRKLEAREGKPLPSSIESEKFVLSGILGDKNNCDLAMEIFSGQNPFYDSRNRTLFEVYQKLHARKDYPDAMSVAKQIEISNLTGIVSMVYLSELISNDIRAMFPQHCRNVFELYLRRRAIYVFNRVIADSYLEELPNKEIYESADAELLSLRSEKRDNEPKSAAELIHLLEEDDVENGIKTPFPTLNGLLNHGAGLVGGDYVVIGARPSVGKTTIAINLLVDVIKQGHGGLFFSSEMKNKRVLGKTFEVLSGIPAWKLQKRYNQFRGQLTAEELQHAAQIKKDLQGYPVFFDDSNGLSIGDIRARVSRWKHRHNVKIVFFDYLQLIRPTDKSISRDRQMSEISEGLKAMAKEFDIPLVILSQLNRESIKRDNKRPSVADLRDSGSIEQDADVIILPFDPLQVDTGNPEEERYVELIVGKNRLGPVGSVHANFKTKISFFEEVSAPLLLSSPSKNHKVSYAE